MKKITSVILFFNLIFLSFFSFVTSVSAADTLYFFHTDHLGSTRVVTDKTGAVVATYDYWPYGSIKSQTGSQPAERLYTSQIFDQDSDLYFYNARYYNPKTGNFISADTIEGPNRYAYVANNPINKTDPSGNFGSFFVGLGSVLSRAVGPVAFLAGTGLTAIGEVYKNIPLELIYGDTPPATVAQATRESGSIISNVGQDMMFGGSVSYLAGAALSEIGENKISQGTNSRSPRIPKEIKEAASGTYYQGKRIGSDTREIFIEDLKQGIKPQFVERGSLGTIDVPGHPSYGEEVGGLAFPGGYKIVYLGAGNHGALAAHEGVGHHSHSWRNFFRQFGRLGLPPQQASELATAANELSACDTALFELEAIQAAQHHIEWSREQLLIGQRNYSELYRKYLP